jgi:hypothetical protein
MSWEEVGREYMEKARRSDAWKSMLYGIVHTNLLSVDRDREAVDRLLEEAPRPEDAKRKCPLDPTLLRDLGFYRPKTAVDAVCDKAENFERIAPLFKDCERSKLQEMKREQIKTGRRELDLVGLKWKGIDMTLLDCGCEVPVIDRHIARYLARTDKRARAILGDPADKAALEARLRHVQEAKTPEQYETLWKIAKEHADRSGLPAGVWHVAVWMHERFTERYPRLSEEKRLELAKRYVDSLF